jgi:hypothetical protein
MFIKESKEHFWIPSLWKSRNYKIIDCFVNTLYFRCWMKYLNIIVWFIYPTIFIEYVDAKYYTWTRYGEIVKPMLTYQLRDDFEGNLKKYKFK